MTDHVSKALKDVDYLFRNAVPVSVGVTFRDAEKLTVQFSGRIQDDPRLQNQMLVPMEEYLQLVNDASVDLVRDLRFDLDSAKESIAAAKDALSGWEEDDQVDDDELADVRHYDQGDS